MIVCVCHVVSDKKLRATIAAGAETVSDVERACRAGTSCGMCRDQIVDMLRSAGACADDSACSGCPRRATHDTSPYLVQTNEAEAA